GSAVGGPACSARGRDFDVLPPPRQRHLSLGTGSTSSSAEWRLTLMPAGPGQRVSPSFRFKGEVSDACEITVSDQPPKADDRRPLFVETELDQPQVHEG